MFFRKTEKATVMKKTASIKKKFIVMDEEGEYTIEGDVFENTFVIKRGEEELAKVSKTIINFFKAYDIQVKEVGNIPTVLSIVIALDIVKYKRLAYIL